MFYFETLSKRNYKNIYTYNMENLIGERLKTLRENSDLTQTELAKNMHLTKSQISSFETGRVSPNIEVIKNYCNTFKVTADYLLGIEYSNETVDLEQQIINQVLMASKRLSSEHRERYLKNMLLYSKFLERYKESL